MQGCRSVRGASALWLLAATVWLGCAGPDPSAPQAPRQNAAPVGPAGGEAHRGMLVYGHEVRAFTPCEGGDDLWVVDETAGNELRQVYESLAAAPYQRVFVEVAGTRVAPPVEGFGSDYRRALVVSGLRRAAREGAGCAEQAWAFEFRARGNEPFWSATIAPAGITVSRADDRSPIVFPYRASASSPDGARVYTSVTELPHAEVSLELREERCVDTMSGERFSHAARLRLDGRETEGCAYAGLPPSGEPLEHSVRTVERKLTGCGADGSEICAWFRFDYPEIRAGLPEPARRAIEGSIAAWIGTPLADGQPPGSPEQLIATWEEDWREFEQSFPDSAQRRRIERRASVLAVGPGYVSLELRQLADLGGAHPVESVILETRDRRTGEPIDLDELLRPDAREELRRAGELEFRRTKGLSPDASLSEAGYWFEGGGFVLSDDFAVTPGGLRFHYDAYEIAPYSMGSTTLDLPWNVVGPLLDEKEKGRLG